MTGEAVQILTPVGRMVQGNPLVPGWKQKDNKPVLDANGQKIPQWFCSIAYDKASGIFDREVWPVLRSVAMRDWPTGEYNAQTFAWKVADGDGRDKRGQPWANKQGFAGHWVVRLASNFPFAVVDMPHKANVPLTSKDQIKAGYYVRACFNAIGNGPNQSPGLYLNPVFVQLMGYGQEIITGPDVGAILAGAGAPPPLPPGASLQPVMPGAPPPPPAYAGAPAAPPVAPQYAPPPPPPPAPTVPTAAYQPPPFPPPGWLPHPSAPGFFYSGQTVRSEAELRANPIAPHPGILTP